MKKYNLTDYVRTKILIQKAFNLNATIPKGYGTRSSDYQVRYDQKDSILRKVLNMIRQFNLPIKYGTKNGVTYLCYEGQQFSFHGYYGTGSKEYAGEWIKTKRKNFCFTRSLKCPYNEEYRIVGTQFRDRHPRIESVERNFYIQKI